VRQSTRAIIGGLCVVALCAVGFIAFQSRYGTWARLERVESSLGTPDGLDKLDSRRTGTAMCVVSCDEARITIAYGVDLDEDGACQVLSEAVEEIADPSHDAPIGDDLCGGTADAGDGALVGWGIRRADDAANDQYEIDWVRAEADRVEGDLIAVVVINSGID
jgi:hypothetical protein